MNKQSFLVRIFSGEFHISALFGLADIFLGLFSLFVSKNYLAGSCFLLVGISAFFWIWSIYGLEHE